MTEELTKEERKQIQQFENEEDPTLLTLEEAKEQRDDLWVIYVRLSQDGRTGTIEDQLEELVALAEQQGFTVVRVYNDGKHSSGFTEDPEERPEYQELREKIKNGDIDGVLVRNIKRLTRNENEFMRLFADMRENNVLIHTRDDGEIQLDDPVELAVQHIQSASQNKAKKQEITNAVKAIKDKVNNGGPHGCPPYGLKYSSDKTSLTPDTDGAAFKIALDVIEKKEKGATYSELVDEFDNLSRGGLFNIVDRSDVYLSLADE